MNSNLVECVIYFSLKPWTCCFALQLMIQPSCKLFSVISRYVITHILLRKDFTGIFESHWDSFRSNCSVCFLISTTPKCNTFSRTYFYSKIVEITSLLTPYREFYSLMCYNSQCEDWYRFRCKIYINYSDVFNDVLSFITATITDFSVWMLSVLKFSISISSL